MVTTGPRVSKREGGSESVPQAQASQARLLRLTATLGDGELWLLYQQWNGGDASNFSRKELVQWVQEQEDGVELQEAATEVQVQVSLLLGSSGGSKLEIAVSPCLRLISLLFRISRGKSGELTAWWSVKG